jgi:hypothetical protein
VIPNPERLCPKEVAVESSMTACLHGYEDIGVWWEHGAELLEPMLDLRESDPRLTEVQLARHFGIEPGTARSDTYPKKEAQHRQNDDGLGSAQEEPRDQAEAGAGRSA